MVDWPARIQLRLLETSLTPKDLLGLLDVLLLPRLAAPKTHLVIGPNLAAAPEVSAQLNLAKQPAI